MKIFLIFIVLFSLALTGCLLQNPMTNQNFDQPNTENCSKQGERPSIFDFTTGKSVPDGKPCCSGLSAIGPKTPEDTLSQGVCMGVSGVPGICQPTICGDGICNQDYEDKCNCREDCQ